MSQTQGNKNSFQFSNANFASIFPFRKNPQVHGKRSWKEFSGLNSESCPTICLTIPSSIPSGDAGMLRSLGGHDLVVPHPRHRPLLHSLQLLQVRQKVTQFDYRARMHGGPYLMKCSLIIIHLSNCNRLQGKAAATGCQIRRGPQHNIGSNLIEIFK